MPTAKQIHNSYSVVKLLCFDDVESFGEKKE